MDSEYIVEMKNITKKFPGITANSDVTIQIKKGEIYALLGENGAGKSTLMSMLFGMYEPDGGEIFIRGKKENISSPSYATQLNIGMVHQHFKLISNYTIAENIILGIEPKGKFLGFLPCVDIKSANKQIAELSARYSLEVNPTDVISEINVSMRQRVEILKMLYRNAEILIFDDGTRGMAQDLRENETGCILFGSEQNISVGMKVARTRKQAGRDKEDSRPVRDIEAG